MSFCLITLASPDLRVLTKLHITLCPAECVTKRSMTFFRLIVQYTLGSLCDYILSVFTPESSGPLILDLIDFRSLLDQGRRVRDQKFEESLETLTFNSFIGSPLGHEDAAMVHLMYFLLPPKFKSVKVYNCLSGKFWENLLHRSRLYTISLVYRRSSRSDLK